MTISSITELALKGAILRQQAYDNIIKREQHKQNKQDFTIYDKNGAIKGFAQLGKHVDISA